MAPHWSSPTPSVSYTTLLFGHPGASSWNPLHFAARIIFSKHNESLHSSALNLPEVSHCFYNKSQFLNASYRALPGLAPGDLQPLSLTVLPRISLPPATPTFFLCTDAAGSLPLQRLRVCCLFTCTSLINHYSPSGPSLNVPSGETSHSLMACFHSFSFWVFIFHISPLLWKTSRKWVWFIHYCLSKARNGVERTAGIRQISIRRK